MNIFESSRRLMSYLFPESAERDPAFRLEMIRLSTRGLLIIGSVTVSVTLLVSVLKLLGVPFPYESSGPSPPNLALLGSGTLALASWRISLLHRFSRLIGLATGFVVGIILIWLSLLSSVDTLVAAHRSQRDIILVLLVGIGALPCIPWHVFVLGSALIISYVVSFAIGESTSVVSQPFEDPSLIVNLMIVTMLCTALAAVNYHLSAPE